MSLHCRLSVPGVLLGTLLFTRILAAQNTAADLVLIHGHILTVDANDSVAQAIAVRHGVIVKVGTDAEVLELRGMLAAPASSTSSALGIDSAGLWAKRSEAAKDNHKTPNLAGRRGLAGFQITICMPTICGVL